MTTAQIIEAGQTLTISFIGDAQLNPTCKVLSRKGQFVIVLIENKIEKKKIYNDSDGNEYIFPFGKYALAPIATI